jgi:GWxTD domain-containing protein
MREGRQTGDSAAMCVAYVPAMGSPEKSATLTRRATFSRRATFGFAGWCGVFVALVALLLPTTRAEAQDTPEFDVDMITLRDVNSGGPRVEVYTRIPRARLRFTNSPNGFVASYEVSVDIIEIDAEGRRSNIVQSPLWERTVRVPSYIETTDASKSDFSTHSLSIDPGLYVFEFQIQDKSSNESFVVDKIFAVRNISGGSALSDVLLLEKFDEATNTIYPNVTKRVGSAYDSLTFFYELYLDEPGDVVINRRLRRVSGGTLPSLRAPVSLEGTASENDKIVFQNSIERHIDSERSQLIARLPVTDLQVGVYEATFQIVGAGGTILNEAQTNFEVTWTGLDEHLANLDEAISQLQYIAKSREVRRIREPDAELDRWQRFIEFWERRDPTPGTARNEKMEEYYYRVAYANRQYSSITDGWRTDRGQVWVLYGEPDIVERHPYNFNVKPYEVWFYYRIGRRFIFVDETGLGDYQLMVPIWDETTRIR